MSFRPIYKLRSWVPSIHHMDYESIVNNPHSIDEIEKQDMIDVSNLSGHDGAIEIIEKNMDEVNFAALSYNTAAVHLFQKMYDESKITPYWEPVEYGENIRHEKLCLFEIARNEAAIPFIEKNYGYLLKPTYEVSDMSEYFIKDAVIAGISENPGAIHILEKMNTCCINIEKLLQNPNAWKLFKKNTILRKFVFESNNYDQTHDIILLLSYNEESLKFVLEYYPDILSDYYGWRRLHYNTSDFAIELLKSRYDEIHWDLLCMNNNPKVIEMLVENKNKIRWDALCYNENAIELLEEKSLQNPNSLHAFLDMNALAANPAIYILDHEKMKEKMNAPMVNDLSFAEELAQKVLHPCRVNAYMMKYGYDLLEDCYEF